MLAKLKAWMWEASDLAMQVYRRPFTVQEKEDKSPLTEADTAVHDFLLPRVAALNTKWAVISEEGAHTAFKGAFWLIDPIDGTKEFIKQTGEFTINIALIQDGVPILGLVAQPTENLLYFTDGDKAFVEKRGQQPRRLLCQLPQKPARVVASRDHGDRNLLDAFLAQHPGASLLARGSSLKILAIAENTADFYPRFGPTCEWDTAAAHAILLAAGGHMEGMTGEPLLYGKPGYRNPHFLARGL